MRNRQAGGVRRSGVIGMTGGGMTGSGSIRARARARIGFATMLLTVLVGLGTRVLFRAVTRRPHRFRSI